MDWPSRWKPVDEGEEPDEFPHCLDIIPTPGYAKEIREEGEGPKFLKEMDFNKPEEIPTEPIKKAVPSVDSVSKNVPTPAKFQSTQPTPEENFGPLYTGGDNDQLSGSGESGVSSVPRNQICHL